MKKKLLLVISAFLASFLVMVALCWYSMGRFNTFNNYTGLVEKTGYIITTIRSAEISVRDFGLNERGYMITRDSVYLNNMNLAIDSLNRYLSEIKKLISDNQEQKNHLALVKATIALRVADARANIAYVDTAHFSSLPVYYDNSRNLMSECTQRLSEMSRIETNFLSERFRGQQLYGHLTDKTLRYLLTFFCIVTLLLFIIMIREFRSRLIYQGELQASVIDLRRSHNELEQIAYVTSHDLQEPLRKI